MKRSVSRTPELTDAVQHPDPSDCSCFGSDQGCIKCGIAPRFMYEEEETWTRPIPSDV